MRKDVRLGLGVGGILFAVVLVYALFFAGDRKTLGEGESSEQANASVMQEASAGGAAPKVTITPPANNAPVASTAVPTPSPSVQVTQTPDTSSGAVATPQKTEIVKPAETEIAKAPTSEERTSPETSTSVASTGTPGTPSYHTPSSIAQWDWSKALQSGARVPTVSETPGGGRDPGAGRSSPTTPKNLTEARTDPRETSTASTSSGKYLVKSGETFWTIAKGVYGDPSYFAHIQRANPRVTPKNLKAGMTINLPPKGEVVPPGADAVTDNATRGPVGVDPMRQYKVRSGDSLSVICERLYGNSANLDRLYQLNKDLIGPNPSALKLNMVLQLPEAPKRGVIAGAQ